MIAAVMPQLGHALPAALGVMPIYVAFAIAAPLLGWAVSRVAKLDAESGRAPAFSAATRNSLVALAVPGAVPLLPAIIVAQTLVELVAELVFIRALLRLGSTVPVAIL